MRGGVSSGVYVKDLNQKLLSCCVSSRRRRQRVRQERIETLCVCVRVLSLPEKLSEKRRSRRALIYHHHSWNKLLAALFNPSPPHFLTWSVGRVWGDFFFWFTFSHFLFFFFLVLSSQPSYYNNNDYLRLELVSFSSLENAWRGHRVLRSQPSSQFTYLPACLAAWPAFVSFGLCLYGFLGGVRFLLHQAVRGVFFSLCVSLFVPCVAVVVLLPGYLITCRVCLNANIVMKLHLLRVYYSEWFRVPPKTILSEGVPHLLTTGATVQLFQLEIVWISRTWASFTVEGFLFSLRPPACLPVYLEEKFCQVFRSLRKSQYPTRWLFYCVKTSLALTQTCCVYKVSVLLISVQVFFFWIYWFLNFEEEGGRRRRSRSRKILFDVVVVVSGFSVPGSLYCSPESIFVRYTASLLCQSCVDDIWWWWWWLLLLSSCVSWERFLSLFWLLFLWWLSSEVAVCVCRIDEWRRLWTFAFQSSRETPCIESCSFELIASAFYCVEGEKRTFEGRLRNVDFSKLVTNSHFDIKIGLGISTRL